MSAQIVAQPTDGSQDRRKWFALALVVAAQFMVVLDVAIVNVALPSIRTDLHFSQESLQWVITAYAIFFWRVPCSRRLGDLPDGVAVHDRPGVFTVASLPTAPRSEGLLSHPPLRGLARRPCACGAVDPHDHSHEGRERNVALASSGGAGGGGASACRRRTPAHRAVGIFINVPAGIAVMALSPVLLRESRADLGHRRFDVSGAVSITSGLMILVYALTRATQHGWGSSSTIGLLAVSAALIGAFFVIEARSKAPLLPLRIFKLRTLTGSNVAGLMMGGAIFAQFFLLTLYMQEVLHYSAIKTGAAYIGLTLTIIAFSAVAQGLVTRVGVRLVLPTGLALSTVALVLFARLPVDGRYWVDLFPAFMISGLGLALAFVPMSIGALTGVREADAGIASGLINTTQQIGGAVGVALATTVATTFTAHYVDAHAGSNAFSGPALTHGFQIAFYVLAALAAVGAVLSAVLVESTPAEPGSCRTDEAVVELEPRA
jgi:MFS family permease